jgi:hypothetical protein
MNAEHPHDFFASNQGWKDLLSKEVSEWRVRALALQNTINSASAELSDLTGKIRAAETLMGERPAERGADAHSAQPQGHMSELARVTAQIVTLMDDGVPRLPREIREALVRAGVPKDSVASTHGNFYNALARLVMKGRLWKGPDGKYRHRAEDARG